LIAFHAGEGRSTVNEDTTTYRDALHTLLTSDAPPVEDEEAWTLITELLDHLRGLVF
jgi:hypothetical protein